MFYRISVRPSDGTAPEDELFGVVIEAPNGQPELAVINAAGLVNEQAGGNLIKEESEFTAGYRAGWRVVTRRGENLDLSGRSAAFQYGYRCGREVAENSTPENVVLSDAERAALDYRFGVSSGYDDARHGLPFANADGKSDRWRDGYRQGFEAGIAAETAHAGLEVDAE